MSSFGSILKKTVSVLTPDNGQTERLTFRRFNGAALAVTSSNGEDIQDKDVTTVTLKINPQEVSYTKPKITQKIQTSSPQRFIIYDWGTDLTMLSISGRTGNMLPAIIQSGSNPLQGIMEGVINKIDPTAQNTEFAGSISKAAGGFSSFSNDLMMKTMSYFELLELSDKYKTFTRLQDMYEEFDADADVLTLEMGDVVYRGYFNNFSFTQSADSPWDWHYTIEFTILDDLSKKFKRDDMGFGEKNTIDKNK